MPSAFVETMLQSRRKRQRCVFFWTFCTGRTCVFIWTSLELLAFLVALCALFVMYEVSADSFLPSESSSAEVKVHRVEGSGPDALLPPPVRPTFKPVTLQPLTSTVGGRVINADGGGEVTPGRRSSSLWSPASSASSSSSTSDDSESNEHGGESSSEEDDNSGERNAESDRQLTVLKSKHKFYVRSMAASAACLILCVFVIALVIQGVLKHRPRFLLPFFFFQVLTICAFIALTIVYGLWNTTQYKDMFKELHLYPESGTDGSWTIVGIALAAALFQIFCTFQVLIYYLYLLSGQPVEDQFYVVVNSEKHAQFGKPVA